MPAPVSAQMRPAQPTVSTSRPKIADSAKAAAIARPTYTGSWRDANERRLTHDTYAAGPSSAFSSVRLVVCDTSSHALLVTLKPSLASTAPRATSSAAWPGLRTA